MRTALAPAIFRPSENKPASRHSRVLRPPRGLDPDGVETVLRSTWSAFHDLLQLLIANGDAAVPVDASKEHLRRELGLDDARLGKLCNVASLTANGDGILNEHHIDPLIKDRGFAVTERNRPAARLASLPHVAEAYRMGAVAVPGDGEDPAPVAQPELRTE